METAYYMFEGDSHDWLPEVNAVFTKQPFFAVDPFGGCDIAVGEALRRTGKADWLMAIRKTGLNRPQGPRIYFGFIFAHRFLLNRVFQRYLVSIQTVEDCEFSCRL